MTDRVILSLVSVQLGLPLELAPTANLNSLAPTSVSPIAPPLDGAVYFVRNRSARRYRLRVDPDGKARVTIPRGGSEREANTFVRRHVGWIARQRARLSLPIETEERGQWREQAREFLPRRLGELACRHGLEVARVSIRDQRTRWGSCGRDGHICLNWRLMLMPDWVRDYVLVHELMHLRHLDHSAQYWKMVGTACPEFREARQWLRLNGPALR